ncbi:unnamed protein product, partial [Mesorhabditis spiculigera]
MASILTLSKRQPDLLADNQTEEVFQHNPPASNKQEGAPKNKDNSIPHELAADGSRAKPTVRDYVNAQRILGGSAHAEHLILELNAAANVNRGPAGVFESSRVHWDLLLGRDETIFPSDYLNYDSMMKY